MVLVNTTRSGVTREEVADIIEDATITSQQKIVELTEKFDRYVEKTDDFRRKLEFQISKLRESQGDIADKLEELLNEWNDL